MFPIIAGCYHLLERSLYCGVMPDEVRRTFELCMAAPKVGIATAKPSVRCNEIDDHVKQLLYASCE